HSWGGGPSSTGVFSSIFISLLLVHLFTRSPASILTFRPSAAPPVCAVELLSIRKIPLQASVLLDEFLAHTPDFFEYGIRHDYRFLRIDWPKRTCGMDSGETMNGATSPSAPHRVSNRAWMTGF